MEPLRRSNPPRPPRPASRSAQPAAPASVLLPATAAGGGPVGGEPSTFLDQTRGAARAIDEKVPRIAPTVNTNANPRMASPPKKYSTSVVIRIRPEVIIVRLRVWLIELLTIGPLAYLSLPLFSRMRSRMMT